MNLNRFLLYVSVFFCNLLASSAQNKPLNFVGSVTNNQDEPLSGVVITLKDEAKILGYKTTDVNGFYKIIVSNIEISNITINAKLLGYKSLSKRALSLSNGKIETNFILSEDTITLQDIVINRKQDIKIKGDTTTYVLKSFRQGNEQTVEDIIKKLPGLNVDNEGNISFKGSRIEKVLLDNEDFYKERYKNLTQHLSQKNIDSIEVIENYVEEDILSNFIKSNKTVLNLKITKDNGMHTSGHISVGLGLNNKIDLSTDNVVWRNSLKFMSIGFFNNIVNSSTWLLRDQTFLNSIMPKVTPRDLTLNNLSSTKLNPNIKGNEFVYNPNFVSNLSKKISIKGSGEFSGKKNLTKTEYATEYVGENSYLNQFTKNENAAKINGSEYELEAKYVITNNSRIRNTLGYASNFNQLGNYESVSQLANNLKSDYNSVEKFERFSNTLNYLKKINEKTVLNIITTFNVINIRQNDDNYTSDNSGINNPAKQASINRLLSLDSYIKLLKKDKSGVSAFTLGLTTNSDSFYTNLNSLEYLAQNNLETKPFDLYAKYGFFRKISDRFGLFFNSALHLLSITKGNSGEDLTRTTTLLPDIIIRNEFKITKKSFISISLNHENNVNSNKSVSDQFVLSGNRSYSKNNTSNVLNYKKTDITTSFSYNDLLNKQLSLNGIFIIGKRPATSSIYFIDFTKISSINYNNYSVPYSLFNLNFSKLLPVISSTIKLDINHYATRFLSTINSNELQTFRNDNTTISTKLLSAFQGNINGDIGCSISFSNLNDRTLPPPPILFHYKVNLFFTVGKFDLSSNNNLFYFNERKTKGFFNSNIKVRYVPKLSKFSFSAELNNAFNQKYFTRISQANLYKNTSTYGVLGRFFILACSYNF